MRQREGAFRILPAPDHVIFMRYTGEDGRRDAEDGAIVRMAGEIIGPGVMGDVLSLLAQSGWRGELVVFDGVDTRSIFFEGGNILAGRTTCDDERLGTILFRYGHIDEEQLASVIARVAHGERFGAAAVALGFVSQEEVFACLSKQIEEIVFRIVMIADGSYAFLEGFDDGKLPWRRAMSAFGVLMESVSRLDEIRFFRARIPDGTYIPERLVAEEKVEADLREIFALIDGRRSVDEIGRVSGVGEFEATKQIYRLAQSGQAAITAPRFRGGVTEVIETANAILKRIHQEADLAGRGTVLRTTIAAFALGRFGRLVGDAGPFEDGTFAARKVAANAVTIAGEAGAYGYAADMLHDYASFALFSLGSSLGEDAERRLAHEIEPLLARLRPATSSSQMIKIVVADDG
ncbi:MAG: DUF4388 domain-containing protein [Myxococcales bacterium]|nr:DUF4388 domain-containing protein [Myxococcales bacterium]MCB9565918.1 DUF4388 domain-containing protein [Myxococcales bacterium]MCB9702900.1 DUF4388 domain-containing protein [Myxococcales bacterium]